MRKFAHINARTVEEATSYLKRYRGRAKVIAGGTDLIGKLKDVIMPNYPEAIINIKTIKGLDSIVQENGFLRVGALARLEDIAVNQTVRRDYTALAEAAHRTASPHIREMGTLGGNICQDIRCWYYRNPNNRFPCLRKGGGRCYAIEGDNRYHSIFGGSVDGGCLAVHPSDTAPALIALGARVKTSKRTIKAEDFFDVGVEKTTVLDSDEIVLAFQIPKPPKGAKSAFMKFALRNTIDFAIVNCATRVSTSKGQVTEARICLNAVYVVPYRPSGAEKAVLGKTLSEKNFAEAAREGVSSAKPVRHNRYMVPIAETLILRSLLACN